MCLSGVHGGLGHLESDNPSVRLDNFNTEVAQVLCKTDIIGRRHTKVRSRQTTTMMRIGGTALLRPLAPWFTCHHLLVLLLEPLLGSAHGSASFGSVPRVKWGSGSEATRRAVAAVRRPSLCCAWGAREGSERRE